MFSKNATKNHKRFSLFIQGKVQGVGFRPFIYRLAKQFGLTGWVNNTPQGVLIEIEGEELKIEGFFGCLEKDLPPNAEISNLTSQPLPLTGYQEFNIVSSNNLGVKNTAIIPDIAVCQQCLAEMFDPTNRRYNYPFINCINCGPRFSIVEDLPYDRCSTTMKNFLMCNHCESEYQDPMNRRFHAQPNACPSCGPQLDFLDREGKYLASKTSALLLATQSIKEGKVVAIKGIGGFHLVTDAYNNSAVIELRKRKHRDEKPFALLYPSLDLVKEHCNVSKLEEDLLTSSISPIVLLRQRKVITKLSQSIAPENPYLGVMLANNPLQHLLMSILQRPVVATSGNISDEPICIDEKEALERLASIADGFLVHNRPISQAIDDSVVQVVLEREMVLRRARGYHNLLTGLGDFQSGVLAVGAHLKNTVSMALEGAVYFSQYIGDLSTEKTYTNFENTIDTIQKVYNKNIALVAYDLHPEYLSTKYAQNIQLPTVAIQHHQAHIFSCMLEHKLEGNLLGVAWDGSGYGLDGNIWGGEFFKLTKGSLSRVAHLRPFPLIGGERAIKEPRRVALALFYEAFGERFLEYSHLPFIKSFTEQEIGLLKKILENKINAINTSSVGRLFDAVAAILGLQQKSNFEAQAAMKLEFCLPEFPVTESYSFSFINTNYPLLINWEGLLNEVLLDLKKDISIAVIAAKFHNSLAKLIVEVAKLIEEEKVVLSGGCFQNRYLLEKTVLSLRTEGFSPYWQQKVPTNDSGISLGQLLAVNDLKKD